MTWTSFQVTKSRSYHLQPDCYLEVVDQDGNVGVVHVEYKTCLCVAYSYNIRCVCLQVAETLSKENGSTAIQDEGASVYLEGANM